MLSIQKDVNFSPKEKNIVILRSIVLPISI